MAKKAKTRYGRLDGSKVMRVDRAAAEMIDSVSRRTRIPYMRIVSAMVKYAFEHMEYIPSSVMDAQFDDGTLIKIRED